MDIKRISTQEHLDESSSLPLSDPFTTTMAAEAGYTVNNLTWLVRNGYLWHPVKGVYVASQAHDTPRLRCAALGLVVPSDCVVVDRHAGWLHGAEMILAPGEHLERRPISMYRPSGHGRLRNDLATSGERNLRPSDIVELNGILVSTPLRTAWDLGRVRWTEQAIAGIDMMLATGLFTLEEFLDGIERFRRMRWITTLRAVGPLADGRSQSPGESVLRLRWIEAGLPTPHPQLEIWRGGVLLGVLDIGNEDLHYGADYHGLEWHGSDEQKEHDRFRHLRISDEGWHLDEFWKEDLFGPKANPEAKLRSGAAEAVRRFGHLAG